MKSIQKTRTIQADAANNSTQHPPHAILIADAGIEDLDTLLNGLEAGIEVQLVKSASEALACFDGAVNALALKRLHVLAHGAPGQVYFGGQTLAAGDFARGLASTGNRDMEIVFWSCRTGADSCGTAFVDTVANATGASVVAANGLVGNSKLGGSWDLGNGQKAPFNREVQQTFRGVLAKISIATAISEGGLGAPYDIEDSRDNALGKDYSKLIDLLVNNQNHPSQVNSLSISGTSSAEDVLTILDLYYQTHFFLVKDSPAQLLGEVAADLIFTDAISISGSTVQATDLVSIANKTNASSSISMDAVASLTGSAAEITTALTKITNPDPTLSTFLINVTDPSIDATSAHQFATQTTGSVTANVSDTAANLRAKLFVDANGVSQADGSQNDFNITVTSGLLTTSELNDLKSVTSGSIQLDASVNLSGSISDIATARGWISNSSAYDVTVTLLPGSTLDDPTIAALNILDADNSVGKVHATIPNANKEFLNKLNNFFGNTYTVGMLTDLSDNLEALGLKLAAAQAVTLSTGQVTPTVLTSIASFLSPGTPIHAEPNVIVEGTGINMDAASNVVLADPVAAVKVTGGTISGATIAKIYTSFGFHPELQTDVTLDTSSAIAVDAIDGTNSQSGAFVVRVNDTSINASVAQTITSHTSRKVTANVTDTSSALNDSLFKNWDGQVDNLTITVTDAAIPAETAKEIANKTLGRITANITDSAANLISNLPDPVDSNNPNHFAITINNGDVTLAQLTTIQGKTSAAIEVQLGTTANLSGAFSEIDAALLKLSNSGPFDVTVANLSNSLDADTISALNLLDAKITGVVHAELAPAASAFDAQTLAGLNAGNNDYALTVRGGVAAADLISIDAATTRQINVADIGGITGTINELITVVESSVSGDFTDLENKAQINFIVSPPAQQSSLVLQAVDLNTLNNDVTGLISIDSAYTLQGSASTVRNSFNGIGKVGNPQISGLANIPVSITDPANATVPADVLLAIDNGTTGKVSIENAITIGGSAADIRTLYANASVSTQNISLNELNDKNVVAGVAFNQNSVAALDLTYVADLTSGAVTLSSDVNGILGTAQDIKAAFDKSDSDLALDSSSNLNLLLLDSPGIPVLNTLWTLSPSGDIHVPKLNDSPASELANLDGVIFPDMNIAHGMPAKTTNVLSETVSDTNPTGTTNAGFLNTALLKIHGPVSVAKVIDIEGFSSEIATAMVNINLIDKSSVNLIVDGITNIATINQLDSLPTSGKIKATLAPDTAENLVNGQLSTQIGDLIDITVSNNAQAATPAADLNILDSKTASTVHATGVARLSGSIMDLTAAMQSSGIAIDNKHIALTIDDTFLNIADLDQLYALPNGPASGNVSLGNQLTSISGVAAAISADLKANKFSIGNVDAINITKPASLKDLDGLYDQLPKLPNANPVSINATVKDTAENIAMKFVDGGVVSWLFDTTFIKKGANVILTSPLEQAGVDALLEVVRPANDPGSKGSVNFDIPLSAPNKLITLKDMLDVTVRAGDAVQAIDVAGAQDFNIQDGGKLQLLGSNGENNIHFLGLNHTDVDISRSGTSAVFTLVSTGEKIAIIATDAQYGQKQHIHFDDSDFVLTEAGVQPTDHALYIQEEVNMSGATIDLIGKPMEISLTPGGLSGGLKFLPFV